MINNERNMRAELEQGVRDGTYMILNPNWSINANPDVERMEWPTYQRVERHTNGSHIVLDPISPREAPTPGLVKALNVPGD